MGQRSSENFVATFSNLLLPPPGRAWPAQTCGSVGAGPSRKHKHHGMEPNSMGSEEQEEEEEQSIWIDVEDPDAGWEALEDEDDADSVASFASGEFGELTALRELQTAPEERVRVAEEKLVELRHSAARAEQERIELQGRVQELEAEVADLRMQVAEMGMVDAGGLPGAGGGRELSGGNRRAQRASRRAEQKQLRKALKTATQGTGGRKHRGCKNSTPNGNNRKWRQPSRGFATQRLR